MWQMVIVLINELSVNKIITSLEEYRIEYHRRMGSYLHITKKGKNNKRNTNGMLLSISQKCK